MQYIIETMPTSFSPRRNDSPLRPIAHIHSDLEIIFNLKGSTIASLDYKEYYVNPGDFFISFPNQIHRYRDQGPREGFCIIFSNDLFKDLKETFQNAVPRNPLLSAKEIPEDTAQQMERIYSLYRSGAELRAQGLFLDLLGQLLPLFHMVPAQADPDTVKLLLNYCFDNYLEDISLDTAAQALHLSKFYISHIFKERMGTGFRTFINLLRTEYACQLLRKEVSITDVAFSSGFSSIRSFNRVFQNLKGMSPREYRQQ